MKKKKQNKNEKRKDTSSNLFSSQRILVDKGKKRDKDR